MSDDCILGGETAETKRILINQTFGALNPGGHYLVVFNLIPGMAFGWYHAHRV